MMRRSPPGLQIGAMLGRYRLEEPVGQSELGPLFEARASDAPTARYLLRVLAVQPFPTQGALANYWGRLQQHAGHITTLQHPYILPLVDYGIANATPYVVWPYVPVRSLSVRLAQSGPVDPLTVGRYLDQIAAALEYTHERGTIHGNLSTDCIYLQPDGRVIVADLGVRRMIELSAQDSASRPLIENADACAPEQLLGGHVDTFTDVYALGAVLYRLLIGHPVFGGSTFGEFAQQHLSSPVPPLSLWQAGLPAGLDALIATAMAKEPEQRFRHPGALANAYHEIVAPNRLARVPFISPEGTDAEHPRQSPASAPVAAQRQSRGVGLTGSPARMDQASAAQRAVSMRVSRRSGGFFDRSRMGRNLLFAALILVIVAGTAYTLAAVNGSAPGAARPTGTVAFVDSRSGPAGHSDAAVVVIHNLGAPASGSVYDVWIINSASERITALGMLSPHDDTFALNDQGDSANGAPGTNLLSLGDKIEVTLEQGHVNLPVGKVQLEGSFPPKAFSHIQHLLVSYPTTPQHIGLLVGLLEQAQLLSAQAQLLQGFASSRNTVAVRCVAQNLIDIIEGAQGPHARSLPAECAAQTITQVGDGFGLTGSTGYLSTAAGHASNAALAPDSTSYIRKHAGHVEASTENIRTWVSTLEQDALALLNDPSNTAQVTDMVTLAVHAYQGVDTNGDEQIDPIAGEAGAVTAYTHGQLMALVTLTAVP